MRRLALTGLAIALVIQVPQPAAGARSRSRSHPTAVIALLDTGINPYHDTFEWDSPRALRHPSTYIDGYPEDAKPLRLTLDEPNYDAAFRKDCEVWTSVEKGQLYWIPGTKIIGALSFDIAFLGGRIWSERKPDCSDGRSLDYLDIIDLNGHGTMTASRAASNDYGGCRDCLIVSVQGFRKRSVRWMGDNASWIDIESHSWKSVVPLWEPTGATETMITSDPGVVRAVEEAARKHPAFWASGNGLLTRGGVLGHPTLADPMATPSVITVGGHDSGYINLWPGFPPHVVSDSCNSLAAKHMTTTESGPEVGSGTSSATPFAAGVAGRILLKARTILGDGSTGVGRGVVAAGPARRVRSGPLADGRFTLGEWKAVVLKTASPRPGRQREDGSVCSTPRGFVLYDTTPVKWKDVPEGYPEFLHIGYGATDNAATARAFRVLEGTAELLIGARPIGISSWTLQCAA